MEHPWHPRPPPPPSNFCPICSNSHYPFCNPPPPYFRPPPPPPPPPYSDQFYPLPPPPPPPPPPQSYDPFIDHHQGATFNPPPPQQFPPRPWNGNPNPNFIVNSNNYGLDYVNSSNSNCNSNSSSSYIVGVGIGVKRMRDDVYSDEERRLKLIRDHGAPSHSLVDTITNYHSEYRLEPNSNSYRNGVHGGNSYVASYGNVPYQEQRRSLSMENRDFNNQFSQSCLMNPRPGYYGLSNSSENVHLEMGNQGFKGHQPPLPNSPPPPLPAEPPAFRYSESVVSRNFGSGLQSQYSVGSEGGMPVSGHYSSKTNQNSRSYYQEEIQGMPMPSSATFGRGREELPPRHLSPEKPKVVNATHILKHPHRASRPDHIVIILRGLPGSGKSYLAKILRDLEVENGGAAPRIHSMDEYFMTEVEKVVDSEVSKSSVSVRGKKQFMKTVMEYCYEPEMEEAYRSSMLKAFKKTLDEGAFPFVIVDDRNLRVADFAQFWATAKRSGYEVYLLEATYKDPAGCAARNVHGFTQNDIHKMADQWEEAPSLYMKLDIKSLLHGDDLEENGIQEVDMDMEDDNDVGGLSVSEGTNVEKIIEPSKSFVADLSKSEQKWDGDEHPVETVKELGKSKWSNNLDEDDVQKPDTTSVNSSALSALTKSYRNKGKSVRWADQVGRIGFSISSGKASNISLVIGSGSGYNLKSNPLPEEEKQTQRIGESKIKNVFQEQLRAERESFRAVFDKRKQRLRGIDMDGE